MADNKSSQSAELPLLSSSKRKEKETGSIFVKMTTVSPGPCYNISSSLKFVSKSLPAFSLKSRPDSNRYKRSPGPNEYNVRSSQNVKGGYVQYRGETYLDQVIKQSNILGPNHYSPLDPGVIEKSKIKGGVISNRRTFTDREMRPGPN